MKDSITAAFNYFGENSKRLVSGAYEDFDYSMYFNDLQNRGVSDEISVAEVVALAKYIMAEVLNKFNIKLEPEVRTYGSKGEISWDTL